MDQFPANHWVTTFQFTPKTFRSSYPAIDPANQANTLQGKVAIVMGASKGIAAKGIVPALAKAGAKGLVLVAKGVERLEVVKAEVQRINPAVQVLVSSVDVGNTRAVVDLFDLIKRVFGHADILVNNAVIVSGPGHLHEASIDDIWRNYEVNTRGTILTTQQFIKLLPSTNTPATVVNLTTNIAWDPVWEIAGYITSKLAGLQFITNVAAMYPSLTAVNVHPGLYDTDNLQDSFRRFDLDDPSLIGGTVVWLGADPDRSRFLSGRLISANWDVEGLVARKEEIVKDNLLVLDLKARLGKEQFAGIQQAG